MKFDVHSYDSAPSDAKKALESAEAAFGFIPNLLGVMAESPVLLKGYQSLMHLFECSSLDTIEKQIVLLTTSYENACSYCVAAHTMLARLEKVPEAIIDAIRDGKSIKDKKYELLHQFTAAVVQNRGWPPNKLVTEFLDNGYTKENVLEVILGVSVKTISNYTNHISQTPLDELFTTVRWSKAS